MTIKPNFGALEFWEASSTHDIFGEPMGNSSNNGDFPEPRLYFSTHYQSKLSVQLAHRIIEVFSQYAPKPENKMLEYITPRVMLPDYIIVPARGGIQWIPEIVQIFENNVFSGIIKPKVIPYIAAAYHQQQAGNLKTVGLDSIIKQIVEEHGDKIPDIAFVDDVVDSGITTLESLLPILAANPKAHLHIFSAFAKPVRYMSDRPLLNGIVHYAHPPTDKWISFVQTLHGFPLHELYSVLELKGHNLKHILLGDIEKSKYIPSKPWFENENKYHEDSLECSYALAKQIAMGTYSGNENDLPALVISILPMDPNKMAEGRIGLTVHDVLQAWPQVDIIRKHLKGESTDSQLSGNHPERKTGFPYQGAKIPYDILKIQKNSSPSLVAGGDYSQIVGNRQVLFVGAQIPQDISKEYLGKMINVRPEQIRYAAFEPSGNRDYFLEQ